ncbi:hypothetical protein ACFYMX_13455 [Streptomyces griseofuscus]|uniref:hypothetical protein n=1 Tax=Streptomyces TaxID=1883 RepID=UPI0013693082|nr:MULTISPECIES: hypothetical protein [unclassified Streptomyces]MBJ7003346.1 hypothetical protein [Streptomyces sp. CRPSP2-6A1]MYQ91586.1 hypothetical protein [Streptomyces sp. SID4946]
MDLGPGKPLQQLDGLFQVVVLLRLYDLRDRPGQECRAPREQPLDQRRRRR